MSGVIGSAIKRREDPALITGKGKYTDDLQLPGMVFATVVRSPHAHARISKIDTSRARAAPGIVAVFTAENLRTGEAGGVIPTAFILPDMKMPVHPILAIDTVRHVGDGVAVIVGEDPYLSRDGAELVEVEWEPLPVVTDAAEAARDGAPQIHPEAPGNICFDWDIGDAEKTEAAFASADEIVVLDTHNNRMLAHPIEPRAAVASYDEHKGELTIWMTSQNPHVQRLLMSLASMGIPEHKIRIIAPEIGGGFGSKIHHYPDEAVAAWCSIQLKRPVKWTSTRSESSLTDAHGRDHTTKAELALDKEGRIQGFRVHTYANLGAYISTLGPLTPTYLYGTLASGQYDMPAIHLRVQGVFTNTAPVDATRGAGRPECTFMVERIMDLAAHQLGLDRIEIRRRNFVSPDDFPYQTQVAFLYDSGDYPAILDKALDKAGYQELLAEQEKRRKNGGKPFGIGICTYLEACGGAPSQVVGSLGLQAGLWESAKVRVHPTGTVTVYTGSTAHGQGHATTFSQIVADKLSIDVDQIEVVRGDTGEVQFGMGTYGSRSGAVGGGAIALTLDKIIAKGRMIAAHLLEAAEDDVTFEDGRYFVRGSPHLSHSFGDVALQAYLAHNLPAGLEPGMEETTFYDPPNFTFPFGAHIAVVEVDPETGAVELVRYIAVDDCGNVINPMIVDGQIHGGIAHGIGQALWEHVLYDEGGQLLSATMMDYAVPRAHNLVSYELDRTVTPSPHNPLGVKGIGEAGAIAAPAAVTNAVMDALEPYGIHHLDMPLTPEKVWRAIHREEVV